ncbi:MULTISPECIES: EamA family transporter [Cyanophyceae]|uniref:EamA family transporter n=1 Tax=Cyanophyceae TaxID=3028117 RepID=UPI00232F062C|nr:MULTISPECIES: EamA family transporter [Cyanophyceae]MDB9356741.1 EamA family transporter [Nodularia spumigena CS-587/03]MDB9316876.1 EamA family transporter [Nodularia spumigena CS-590/01A]MDB9338573.1 EamA family transporter [Nodularia spumigena CS-589/07]MDB9398770.1 EamA family transporter [Microcystis aeruginosa CS-567/02-A1]MDB9499123.1 EamA family transporter [Nodularia spumigena CS-336/02]
MGRFEKRPDNPRVRGDLSRAAETALWAVVEDLESLQQNVLRSLQEEIKRLQADKTRLSDEIQQLLEEKEHLQQVRQITEQQVLIRQLSEALAKHISSQLQSSLASLASKSAEGNSQERSAMKSAGDHNQNAEQMLGTLDDTLTITFNSLQQELKNYQNNLSQQLSRMQSQQQQGEAIVEEFINHLRGELEKTTKEISPAIVTAPPSTILPPTEQQPPRSSQTHLQSGVIQTSTTEPSSTTTGETTGDVSESNNTAPSTGGLSSEKIRSIATEPISVIGIGLSEGETKSPPAPGNVKEPISVISSDFSEGETKSPPKSGNAPEPISVISRDFSEGETKSPPASGNALEPISVISSDFSEGETKSPPKSGNAPEPISVINRESLERKTKPLTSPPVTKEKAKLASSHSPSSRTFSPIQIGFLLVVLSTVVSSLYNIVIKGMFFKAYDNLGVLEIEGIISPTLGNILLILMLRLLVVVPLMLLLAPMMHPQVWQDMQNILKSLGGSSTPNSSVKKQRILQLSIASGCFLFLSQVLIYVAIGQVATGMAIALFFVYPMMSGLLSWLLFRDRPNGFRSAAMGAIFCGELLVLGGSASLGLANFSLGSSTAIFAGVAFACYVILTRVCATKLHPVSFTVINFTTMLVLSFICLMLPLPSNLSVAVQQSNLLELILSAFILGVLTLVGYVLNNVGIRKLGALPSAIIGAGVPILTVVFAGLILQETLEVAQVMGVVFVSFGVAAYSFEKMRTQVKPSRSEN